MSAPRNSRNRSMAWWRAGIAAILFCVAIRPYAQQAPQSPQTSQSPKTPPGNNPSSAQEPASEMAVKDEATTAKVAEAAKFRVNVRLVLARVVVRDSSGH